MRHLYSIKQQNNKRIDKIKDKVTTLFLVITFLLFVGSLMQTYRKIQKINKEIASRQNQLESLKKEEEELKKKYEEITSDEYIEKQLRNQLNLAKDNEIVLVLPPDEVLKKLVPPDEEEETFDIRPNWRKWIDVFGL